MRQFTDGMKANLVQVSSCQIPIVLLEIRNEASPDVIYLAQDSEDVYSNGQVYSACYFEVSLPDDKESQIPRAAIAVPNIGRELTRWFEQLQGAPKTKVTFKIIQKHDPDTIELEYKMDLVNIVLTNKRVTGNLSYRDTLNKDAVPIQYRPETAPGLF